jgi:hypothetical protein
VKHTDLGRVTTDDGYRWVDHLVEQGVSKKSVRDVWVASLKAVASFMVERRKLEKNPFAGIRIRGVKATKDSNKKGFSDAQAETILIATLATPSHLTTPETRAARRWVPWACACTAARVNEITSLLPSDVRQDTETKIWSIYLRPEMTKGDYERVIPVHSHLIEQRFLDYVEKRRKARLPLFYDPKRARGGVDHGGCLRCEKRDRRHESLRAWPDPVRSDVVRAPRLRIRHRGNRRSRTCLGGARLCGETELRHRCPARTAPSGDGAADVRAGDRPASVRRVR